MWYVPPAKAQTSLHIRISISIQDFRELCPIFKFQKDIRSIFVQDSSKPLKHESDAKFHREQKSSKCKYLFYILKTWFDTLQ